MHTFQPYPIDKMEFNPFTKIGKEWALVSAGDKTRCNTMTVSWGGVGVLWGKNVVFIFIRDSRYTKEFLDNGGLFSLSFPVIEFCYSYPVTDYLPQHFLYFLPLPHGHGSFLPTFGGFTSVLVVFSFL